jgi:hypothetical protein
MVLVGASFEHKVGWWSSKYLDLYLGDGLLEFYVYPLFLSANAGMASQLN